MLTSLNCFIFAETSWSITQTESSAFGYFNVQLKHRIFKRVAPHLFKNIHYGKILVLQPLIKVNLYAAVLNLYAAESLELLSL